MTAADAVTGPPVHVDDGENPPVQRRADPDRFGAFQ